MVTISYQRLCTAWGQRFRVVLLVLAACWLGGQVASRSVSAQSTQTPATAQAGAALAQLTTKLQQKSNLPLIVELAVPGYDPAAFAEVQAAGVQEAAIATVQTAVLNRLAVYNPTNVKTFPYVPYLALTVATEEALTALAADPRVVRIIEDRPVPALLADSVPLMRADTAHGLFYRGSGQTVAVLDTGVDKSHPALVGKVVAEACYSSTNGTQGSTSVCPGGVASSTANNSGLNCLATISSCDHGTHVAGIVAGVAPAANLIAMQVFSRFTDGGANAFCSNAGRTSPCALTYASDQLAALNRVYALRNTYNIAAVNMSLGGGQFTAPCNNDALKSIIELLRGAGIATVISAGNSSFRNAMGSPACISAAISVGATAKNDTVASYSNIASFTTLLATGSDIVAPVLFDNYDDKNGTSMAAPHVAGAVAVFKQARSNATVNDIVSALTGTGPLISDQRSGGTVSKRRLDVYAALCALITCDSDDYRFLAIPQTVTGNINPANDRDHYFIFGAAGLQVTLQLNRTSGNLDPYLELFDPNGVRVALNDNGGIGSNALINGYTMLQTGRYQVIVRGANNATGGYSLTASAQAVALNPVPNITSLSPGSATGTLLGSDFWVRINGSGFTAQTQAYWNGQLRTKSFTNSNRMWIRVRGSDLGLPWPRNATIQVRNPEPGGGYSNPRTFNITFPFLGESELVQPASGETAITGIKTTFVISWTHPTDSWRTMQNMDLRLRDQNGNVAAWIRVVERPGEGSTYRLLNGAESAGTSEDGLSPDEGLPGEDRNLVITDTVTLHLADTKFSGSGRTAIMTPTVTFGPAAVGVYNIEFRVDGPNGEVQDDDVLGQITIAPAECPFPVGSVTLGGPETGQPNTDYIFTAALTPLNATQPISYTWSPEPKVGQGTANAVYNFPSAGEHFIFLGVENCGSFAADLRTLKLRTTTTPDLSISKSAPSTALAGEAITYTLTITNSGATTATGLIVTDDLPTGATYLSGGTLVNNSVRWTVPSLAGFGTVTQTSYIVTASSMITNTGYAVSATGGFSANGTVPVVTRIVAAQVNATALTTDTLSHSSGPDSIMVALPAGAVADPTRLVLDAIRAPTYALPSDKQFAGRAFRLEGYRNNQRVTDLTLGETIAMTVSYRTEALNGASEEGLGLYAWDGSQWSNAGLICTVESAQKRLHCAAEKPRLTQFALLAATQSSEPASRLFLPLVQREGSSSSSASAQITAISVAGDSYSISYQTNGFTAQRPGQHLHFFFNTVPTSEAGAPGAGPWWIYATPSPYTGIKLSDRPAGATQLCVLVANADHSVQPGTGNCFPLPG
jgi:uncharacterized repeat protein (TIGR01451 family)